MTNTFFHQTIELALQQHQQHPEALARAQAFISTPSPRYLIGKNPQSLAALQWLPCAGLIDDTAHTPSEWHTLPVLPMKAVPADAWVLNCSSAIAPVAVMKALQQAGLHQSLNLCDLIQHPDCPAALWPEFLSEQRQDYTDHQHAWHTLYQHLADNESQTTLLDVLRYRLTANPHYLRHHTIRFQEQYFEDFLHLHQETFVDAGGFDGDTTLAFCKHDPDYQHIYLIEPSHTNMHRAQERLAHLPKITFIEQGLSHEAGQLNFNPEAGSASTMDTHGSHQITVNTLDQLVQHPVSFIKMDLEGWELHALAGSKTHIQTHQPKLALSVYHQASHFREVFNTVLDMAPHYTVRLRHYTQGWSETIMFFTAR